MVGLGRLDVLIGLITVYLSFAMAYTVIVEANRMAYQSNRAARQYIRSVAGCAVLVRHTSTRYARAPIGHLTPRKKG